MTKKVFIVEDEPDLRDTLQYNFENEGFKVKSFPNGESFLETIKNDKPNLVILDLMLPGISGLDVCRDLRMNEVNENVAVVMLTAKSEEIDRIVGFELGADDYVTKPFSVRELILRVKVLLKKRSDDIDQNLLEFGPIAMNLDAHDVSVEGKNILLTALEFKLLKHLLKRKGRVQTRDQLLGDVWGYSSEVTTRTVDTHIKRLREKLGKPGELIQTIRGVGYRFNN
ncbi:response regulator [Gammaproteobacteria bacterium]|jgi:two-component system phosphate regulon response regulator PhoB|nr:response regulator [Gammaproteobacteria bacterium]|tara:strand:+ start:2172 stop:2849 length:678 start_codon:yes stop_codon:yes gene_type:complete